MSKHFHGGVLLPFKKLMRVWELVWISDRCISKESARMHPRL
uniref:Uncharacterized protein n=1 Tax=Kalanchoe fedtschenkoi TaxID=63787 RepID=A0A7N0VN61_KALFE